MTGVLALCLCRTAGCRDCHKAFCGSEHVDVFMGKESKRDKTHKARMTEVKEGKQMQKHTK